MKVRNEWGQAHAARHPRNPLNGREAADLLYAPPEGERPAARPAAPHAPEDERLVDFARTAAHVAGMLFDRYPDEVREAFRWGREDAARTNGANQRGGAR